jgi:hypothetical protein
MSRAWIQTFSNIKFDILNPKPEMVRIEDIAHALSLLCRFTGHTKFFYSVGQHSYLGSFLVPPKDGLWFLLHDASEAFLGDVSSPLKHLTPAGKAYLSLELRTMEVIIKRFGLSSVEPNSIRKIDRQMLYAEKALLMKKCNWDRLWWGQPKKAPIVIKEMSPREVEFEFLDRYYQLKEDL